MNTPDHSGYPDLDELMRRIRDELQARKAQKSSLSGGARGTIFHAANNHEVSNALFWERLRNLRIIRGLVATARGVLLLRRIPGFDAWIAAAEGRLSKVEQHAQAPASRQDLQQNEVSRTSEQLRRVAAHVSDLDARLTKLGEFLAERERQLDAFYVSFEDRYRGTTADIKERQRVYLPHVQAAAKATGGAPVIDVGCGRGEWLELLLENGLCARGYDLNGVMVERCRRRGLHVTADDAVAALRGTRDDSLAAVTGFHIIEHLSFDRLVQLVDQSLRTLRAGGVIIFETPNPANLQVATERFYIDPTHLNPLPSELVSFVLEARGFNRVEVRSLHPIEWSSGRDYDDPMLALLQRKLFGPQDYGVIGWKDR